MKIWVIGRNYPTQSNGMQGSFELEQAKMLASRAHDVVYLAMYLHPIKTICSNGIRAFNEDGVEACIFRGVFMPRVFPVYFCRLRGLFWRKLFREAEKKYGLPDIVHIHYPAMLMNADVLAAYRKRGVKVVATEHWSKVLTRSLDIIEKKEFSKFGKVADAFLCVGPSLTKEVRVLLNRKVYTLPNIVNGCFKYTRMAHEGFSFIAVGRLDPVKQFDRLIEAFASCFHDMDVRLYIVGEGGERAALKAQIEMLGMNEKIILTGRLPHDEVAEMLNRVDCLVCCSKYETFGVPVAEAWASGVPVIVSKNAAVASYLNDDLGIMISPRSREELELALLTMYRNYDRYDGERIAKYANEHFSETAIYNRMERIYKGLLEL